MILRLISLSVLLLSFGSINALDISLTHCSFKAGNTNYIEVYLQVVGITANFDTLSNGKMAAAVETSVILKNGEEIVSAERFILNSPEFTLEQGVDDFVDVRRYIVPNGEYILEATFQDAGDTTNRVEVIQPISVNFNQSILEQSDLRFLSSFTAENGESAFHHNGYFLEPLPFNYYHRNSSTLIIYNEVYGAAEAIGSDYMVTYSIQEETQPGQRRTIDFRHKRLNPEEVNVVLAQLDISHLPSGNYVAVLEVKDREQKVLSSRELQFTRSNPLIDIQNIDLTTEEFTDPWLDTLTAKEVDFCMMAIEPIMSGQEVVSLNYLLDVGEIKYKKNFLHHFWTQKYGENAPVGFGQYMKVARAIHNMYRSGMGYGFETDRGRIYLKYGRPDEQIRVEDDQGAFPYEIWFYNKIAETGQTDVRFLFYNPELATNHYLLLTSTCRGERNNIRWEMVLYRNSSANQTDNRVDATTVQSSYRRRARELYEN